MVAYVLVQRAALLFNQKQIVFRRSIVFGYDIMCLFLRHCKVIMLIIRVVLKAM